MSDRSYAQVIVYDCPEDQRSKAREAIYEAFEVAHLNEEPQRDTMPGSSEFPPDRWVDITELVLGERYGDDECGLDMNDTIAAALIEAAPGATFATWVDPKYEYPGVLTMHAPDLGRWDGTCDSDGNPYVTAYEIKQKWVRGDCQATYDAIAKLVGMPWEDRIDSLQKKDEVA